MYIIVGSNVKQQAVMVKAEVYVIFITSKYCAARLLVLILESDQLVSQSPLSWLCLTLFIKWEK